MVVLRYPSLELVEYQVARIATTMPYIPGFLSFREYPALLAAWEQLSQKPDLLFVDGHGISHPRRLGVASHFGLLVDVPTIGVAKKRLCGTFEPLAAAVGALAPLVDKGEQLAWVWRSKARCNPLFIATGHRVSVDSALAWVQRCMEGYRLPEPTRWADAVASASSGFSAVVTAASGGVAMSDFGYTAPQIIFAYRELIMLQNPIHLRLERLESWQHVTFMACLCERMYPNYATFCKQTGFGDGHIYRRILDLIWETLTVKDAKVNFDSQLEKLEEAIPAADDFDLYGVYPAIDACVALSELLHSRLSGETLEHAIEVSKTSIRYRGDAGNDPGRSRNDRRRAARKPGG